MRTFTAGVIVARLVSVAILEVKRYAGAAAWVPVRRWPQEIRGQVVRWE